MVLSWYKLAESTQPAIPHESVWLYMPIISTLGRGKQGVLEGSDHPQLHNEFQANLGCMRLFLKIK